MNQDSLAFLLTILTIIRESKIFSSVISVIKKYGNHVLMQITHRDINRSMLAQVLLNQNRDYQCGIKTLANIDLLLSENTVAIVTGQQVGLFTGPLYTLYKILTTLKLTEQLSQQYPEYNFVPIFWLEGEDHDIEEVSSFSFLNASNELQQLTLSP